MTNEKIILGGRQFTEEEAAKAIQAIQKRKEYSQRRKVAMSQGFPFSVEENVVGVWKNKVFFGDNL